MLRLFACASLLGFLAACGTGSATLSPSSTPPPQSGGTATVPGGAPADAAGNPNPAPPNAAEDAGAATFDGSIGAAPFNPTNAIFAYGPGPDGVNELAIKVSDQADDCAVVTAAAHRRGAKSLWVRMRGISMDTPSVTIGNALQPGVQAFAEFYDLDSHCIGTLPEANSASLSGTVNLQVGDPNGIASGQFTLTMGSQGDHVAGTFAAAPCRGLLALIANPSQTRSCE